MKTVPMRYMIFMLSHRLMEGGNAQQGGKVCKTYKGLEAQGKNHIPMEINERCLKMGRSAVAPARILG